MFARKLGVDELLRAAMDRGAVLCGGSCGGLCWFDAGHSGATAAVLPPCCSPLALCLLMVAGRHIADALAPTTCHPAYRDPSLVEGEGAALDWEYTRVKCLGFVDAFFGPHADQAEKRCAQPDGRSTAPQHRTAAFPTPRVSDHRQHTTVTAALPPSSPPRPPLMLK